MYEISYLQMFVFITVCWIIFRVAHAIIKKEVKWKRELQLLLVYICIVVIARYIYFPRELVNGKIALLKVDLSKILEFNINWRALTFLWERYDGWKGNVIGNISMFIPVGIVWPVCFKELNSISKVTLAGFVYTLLIEISQLPLERVTDVDDLILNTTGTFIGALIYFSIKKIRNK
ncbi:MAG: VanZ family protein [Pseudobutyrivibrio sp.]|nr:VanZ family protein [Pseudobutyrivibrio sp.]